MCKNPQYARDLEKLKTNQTKEAWLMKSRHSEESKKRASDITSGKTKEEFDRIKRAEALRNEYNKKSSGKPTDLKSEFNEKVDFRVARYMKEEREKTTDLKQEFNKKKGKPPDIEKDFRVARYMKQQKNEKADTRKERKINKKEFNASRDIEEGMGNVKHRGNVTDRNASREPG